MGLKVKMATSAAVKFGRHVKELRIHLCQTSPASKGVRKFIEDHYVTLKENNPKFPILVRECSGITPKVYARYDLGKEHNANLKDLTSAQVLNVIKVLVSNKS